eukprot:5190938-Prymnesium_polylepis.2
MSARLLHVQVLVPLLQQCAHDRMDDLERVLQGQQRRERSIGGAARSSSAQKGRKDGRSSGMTLLRTYRSHSRRVGRDTLQHLVARTLCAGKYRNFSM